MSVIDFIIAGILLLAAIVGGARGFVRQAGTVAGLVAGVLVCRFFGSTVSDKIVTHGVEHEALFRVLVYALVFAAVFFGVQLLASLFCKALTVLHVRLIDRIAGALFSIVAWALIMSVALNVYLAFSPGDRTHFNTPTKPWRPAIVKVAPRLMGFIATGAKV